MSLERIRGAERVNKKVGFRLTERDLDIFGFLLDQSFASLDQLYFRFFDNRKSTADDLPKGLHVVRQRLQILRKAGLIFTEKVYTESKSVYLLSRLGFNIFASRRPNDAYAEPLSSVDFRSYEHDTRVNNCRIALERGGKVGKWLSDRRLKKDGFRSKFATREMPKGVIPDGVFISKKGSRVVFELELSVRKKARHEAKYNAFRTVMHGENKLLHHVLWVGLTPQIVETLKEITQFSDNFSVEPYQYFINKFQPKEKGKSTNVN